MSGKQAAERRQIKRFPWLQLTLQPRSVAPPGLIKYLIAGFLGLTPQAKYLPRLRRSIQGHIPSPGGSYNDSTAGPWRSLIISSSGAIAGQ